jgi:peroxiredoxin
MTPSPPFGRDGLPTTGQRAPMQPSALVRIRWALTLALTFGGWSLQADSTPATATDPDQDFHGPYWPAPGHSMHGETFNEGPRRAAILLPNMPMVNFAITSSHPQAQAFFNQGIGQLHGFWYFEAERSFRQVAFLDPEAAMAYWGMAMANVNNASRARGFIERAVARKAQASNRESRWIDALAQYWQERNGDTPVPETQRRRDYVRALESLVQDFPEDIEARAFLTYQIWDNAGFGNERPLAITSHQAVDALLDGVFVRDPRHPAHHYRIHLWDREKPERALASAALGGPSGPGIAHLWHMPSHTYDKLHRYADAAWHQEASARVDHAHLRRARLLPDQIHNYAHNQEWLARSLSHQGRVHEALEVARNLTELPRHPHWNHLDKGIATSSYGRRRLAELLVRWELWDDATLETTRGHLETTTHREQETLRLFTLGLARLRNADTTHDLDDVFAGLEKVRAATADDRTQAADNARTQARQEKRSREDMSRAMAEAMLSYEKEMVPVEEALAELRGWQAALAGDTQAAAAHFSETSKMPKTRQSYAWLAAGNLAEAEKWAREAATTATNQLHELAVLCDILWQAGRTNEAMDAFGPVRFAAAVADPDLPVLKRLQPVADALGIQGDWRLSQAAPNDLGERPPLDTLGPRLWEPYPAPAWNFQKADGSRITSTAFSGCPYLLVFYLGHGCVHCIQQLKAMVPVADDYAAAGLPIIAISLDAPEDLAWTLRRTGTKDTTPFLVVSDESLDHFRTFHAYDDFEDRPLHGTFLVDASGRIRWQDIGAEPFMEVEFLLAEATRLLGF